MFDSTLVPPLLLGFVGAVFGLVSDRFAVRWPEHDDEHPAGRAIDWRTVVSAAIGAFAFWLLADRFGDAELLVQGLFGLWFATLVVGFAIDLDQRLLPDELTLPIIPLALLLDIAGRNPLVGVDLWPAIAIAVVVPVGLYLAAIPFGEGSFGLGDVKLLVGVGLMTGFMRTFTGLLTGLLVAGLVLVVLLATRRIGRRTFVPFGPFLIFGALWGIFVRV
ncbi:MAG: leader peptidase (prepilin peptidase) / N-methyltransferase [Chloroflexota bacterium]|nr:leader peptidase (prepilin peptidase) / N-methyltransferase [Chloroflexota bacterium]